MYSAFVIIDKPKGITSFNALFSIKKQYKMKRVGHAGTLDLSASGLIIAAIGKCTRLLPYIEIQDKVYTFDLHLGTLTDTLEPTGNILKQDLNITITEEKLNQVLQSFIGEIEQVPPAYSAIKINGKRASDLALKGQNVELKPRKINIYELKIIPSQTSCKTQNFGNLFSIYCKCSKGTYIRSLARDIAEKLGTYGVAGNIRRLSIGNISVEQASDNLILPQNILSRKVVNINEDNKNKILNGLAVANDSENIYNEDELVFLSFNELVIALAENKNNYFVPKFLL